MRLESYQSAVPRAWALPVRLFRDSLLRNSAYIMATTASVSLLGYGFWIVAARTYSPHEVGVAAALVSAMTLASALSNMGLYSTLVQLLPRSRADWEWSLTLNTALAAGGTFGLLAGIVTVVLLPLLSKPLLVLQTHPAELAIFVMGVPVLTLSMLVDYTFVAERRAAGMLWRNLTFGLLRLPLLGAPLFLVQTGHLAILGSWVLAGALTCGVTWLVAIPRMGRRYTPVLRGMSRRIRSMLSMLAANHFINLGNIAPMYLLPIFVAVRVSTTGTAYFYTTWMLTMALFMVSRSVAPSLLAEGTYTPNAMAAQVRLSILLTAAFLVPGIAAFLLGGRFLLALFGAQYAAHGTALLVILVASTVPDAITNIYSSVLRIQHRFRLAAWLNLGMASVALAGAWVLLPPFHILGAGYAWLVAEICGSLVVGLHLMRSRERKT